MFVVETAELAHLSFGRGGALAGDTEIAGEWIVEEGEVRMVRRDGRGEHRIELLGEDRILVELPIGVRAYYVREGG